MKIKNSLKSLKKYVKSGVAQVVTRKDGSGKKRKVVIIKDPKLKRRKTKQ